MSRSYSEDLRVRVIAAVRGGLSTRQAAARFGIGVSTVGTWYRRYRATGETAARKQGQPGGSKLDAHEGFILALIDGRADIRTGIWVSPLHYVAKSLWPAIFIQFEWGGGRRCGLRRHSAYFSARTMSSVSAKYISAAMRNNS